MKINRYSSVTGWVRVLSEGPLCQWWWPEWHECLSLLETLLGQDKGVHLMSYLSRDASYFPFSSWYLNCSESRQGTTASIWSLFELLIKSQRWNREGHIEPRLWLKSYDALLSSDFHDEIHSVIIIRLHTQTEVLPTCIKVPSCSIIYLTHSEKQSDT